jgi:exo-1,4-beta-D-glucosaminidase
MVSEAYRLANHPSVIGFLIGSDFPPEERAARLYAEALEQAEWDLPVVASGTVEGSAVAGPSGMKMTGPYAWVPPGYWYLTDPALGGAVGFNSETSAGNNIPRAVSLERMLSPAELEQLWRDPGAKQFHAGPPSEFDNVEIFHRSLSGRYGEPRSLRDFAQKAQLSSYESTRAQFEAYGSRTRADLPATGLVYWMLNSAWPSLNWQLWDHYLDPAGAYFGTKKANEPLHVQYAYGEDVVTVVNRTNAAAAGLGVRAVVREIGGSIAWSADAELATIGAGETLTAMPVVCPGGLSATYFLELWLFGPGGSSSASKWRLAGMPADRSIISRNVYWLSAVPDVLALGDTDWRYTPTSSFADLRGLESLGSPVLDSSARVSVAGPAAAVLVTVTNPSVPGVPAVPAVGVHASVLTPGTRRPVAPVLWDENDVVLFGGQSVTLEARVAAASVDGAAVEIDAFNLPEAFEVAWSG